MKKRSKKYTEAISKIEKGAVDLSRSQIVKFATVFGVTASVLMGDTLSPAAGPDLDPDDQALLNKYHMLSDEGKGMLQNRVDELIALGKTVEEEAKKDRKASG